MTSLPPGWEPDYDGSRWLYRYTPTGLTQFTFPKPGDEFPDFVVPGAEPITLAPEERLASEKQIKLRKTGMLNTEEVINDFEGDASKDENLEKMSATGYFDPSEFMYYADDGELTPIAGKEDQAPRYPLGFVAELPSSDTMLCAEELAPIELDAGPFETRTTNSPAERQNDSSITLSLTAQSRSQISLLSSASRPTNLHPLDEDDIYSAGPPTQVHSSLDAGHVPTFNRLPPQYESRTSAQPVITRTVAAEGTRFSFTPIPQPVRRPSTGNKKPSYPPETLTAIDAAPLVSTSFPPVPSQKVVTPRRSVDDIKAMPISLQAHEPSSNRMRSKSATYETWKPTIKFVQAGVIQESQVSTPASSGMSILQQQQNSLNAVQETRISSWLSAQALGRPFPEANDALGPDPASSRDPRLKAIEPAQQQKYGQDCNSSERRPSGVVTGAATLTGLYSPLPSAKESQKEMLAGPEDRVVESIIEIPPLDDATASRGVQLCDVSPGLSKSGVSRRGAVKMKRFSWEGEADGSADEATGQSTIAVDSTPSPSMGAVEPSEVILGTNSSNPSEDADNSAEKASRNVTGTTDGRLPAVAHTGRHPNQVIMHPSPITSPIPSPRLPFEDRVLSPTCGRISVSKAVLVKTTEERKASIATFEAGPQKPLPPLPLVPKGVTALHASPKQPRSNAFEQMSELIAVANAAMPSARPLSALPSGPTAEGVWRNLRTQASRSALGAGLTTAPLGKPSTMTLNLPGRTVRHSRSISQLAGSDTRLGPPARHHSRSRSMVSTFETSPTHPRLFDAVDRSSPSRADGSITAAKAHVVPAPSDGHKSHKRLSIHLTPAGTFPYHPLRSSPVFAPTLEAPEKGEPQPVDYVKKQAPAPLQLKTHRDRAPKSSKGERPRLQVKMPFIGLPSSPRPMPKRQPEPETEPKPEQHIALGMDERDGESVIFESVMVEHPPLVSQRRRSTLSQVSSPTSSIFSSMRDSSVSATSSMADRDTAPLADLVADLVALDKHQTQLVQRHSHPISESKSEATEHIPTTAAEVQTVQSPLPSSSTAAAVTELPEQTSVAGVFIQRPPNVPKAIRPAGTRASLWGAGAPKIEEGPTDQPPIPTVIVRAPTVKLRPPERQDMPGKSPPVPQIPKLPPTALESSDLDKIDPILPSAQPKVEIVQSDDDVDQQTEDAAKPQGFLQSIRKSWQFTTSNTPRLSLLAGQGHTRSKSQSTLPEPQGKLADGFAMAKKQAVMPWQWADRDNWPKRDSVPVDTRSISNVGAAIRFFNASFQARRPGSETTVQSQPECKRPDFENDAMTSTIVVRRVGPPVVVRLPC